MSVPVVSIIRAMLVTPIPGARFDAGDVLSCGVCGALLSTRVGRWPAIFQALSTGEQRIVCVPHQRAPTLS